MNARLISAFLLACAMAASAAPAERKQRADIAPAPPRPGTRFEEQRQVMINGGDYKVTGEAANQSVSLRYCQRVKLTRRVQNAENEDVVVEDFAEDSTFYAATPPPLSEKVGILNQTHLHARKRGGQWLYELQDKKPTELHTAALIKLAWMTSALDAAIVGIGSQPRTTGDTWKLDLPPPRGRVKGQPVLSGYECTLAAVEEIDGADHARILVKGKIDVEQPTYAGASSVSFSGHVLRRLKDKVDVETKLEGTVSYSGPVTALGKAAKLEMNLPFTLLRSQRVLPR
jgi:hypothetical protein